MIGVLLAFAAGAVCAAAVLDIRRRLAAKAILDLLDEIEDLAWSRYNLACEQIDQITAIAGKLK